MNTPEQEQIPDTQPAPLCDLTACTVDEQQTTKEVSIPVPEGWPFAEDLSHGK